jgi:hypothetical protein
MSSDTRRRSKRSKEQDAKQESGVFEVPATRVSRRGSTKADDTPEGPRLRRGATRLEEAS